MTVSVHLVRLEITIDSHADYCRELAQKSYVFDVKMTCGGCSGAVSRALGKMDGLQSYEVDLAKQSVVVIPTTATYDDVHEKIRKTGKEIRSGEEVDKDDTEVPTAKADAPAEVVAA